MTESDKLITLAKRYCIENMYPKEHFGGPRYNALDAILKGLEMIVDAHFTSIDDCKNKLKDIGANSQTFYTTGPLNEIKSNTIQDERQKFVLFIDRIKISEFDMIEPLPYRRHLSEMEASEIRKELLANWNFDGGYWEPLVSSSPKPFIFFDKENLATEDFEKIRKLIGSHTNRIYEITEERLDYELDSSEFDADSYETVYTDKNYDWIIYTSHEGTIAFGGDWLLPKLAVVLADNKAAMNKW